MSVSTATDQVLGSKKEYVGSKAPSDPLGPHDESIVLSVYHRPRWHL